MIARVAAQDLEGRVHRQVAAFGEHALRLLDRDPAGTSPLAQLRGLLYAHMGWLFTGPAAQPQAYAPDLMADGDIRLVDRLFPVIATISVLTPFFLGWLVTGRLAGAIGSCCGRVSSASPCSTTSPGR